MVDSSHKTLGLVMTNEMLTTPPQGEEGVLTANAASRHSLLWFLVRDEEDYV